MKTIQNKKLNSPYQSYANLIETAIGSAEAKMPIIRKAMRIGTALDGMKEDKIELDEEDLKALIFFAENADYTLRSTVTGQAVALNRELQTELIEFVDYLKTL